MTSRRYVQLMASGGGAPGSDGFKLTGRAREGAGLCRVWLRRAEPWDRYISPRMSSDQWDVRAYEAADSAFEVIPEFTLATLDRLAEQYTFPGGADELSSIGLNGDPLHDRVVRWARQVTGAPDPGEVPVYVVPEPSVRYREGAAPASKPVPSRPAAGPATASAASPAAASPAAASPAAAARPAPPPRRPVTAASAPVPAAAAAGAPSAAADAAERLVALRSRLEAGRTGANPTVPADESSDAE